MKFDIRETLTAVDGFYSGALRQTLQNRKAHQVRELFGHRAIAVGDFFGDALGLIVVFDVGNALIGAEALRFVGNIGTGGMRMSKPRLRVA